MKSLQLFLFGHKNAEPYLKGGLRTEFYRHGCFSVLLMFSLIHGTNADIKADKHAIRGLGGLIGRKKGAVAIYINFSGIRMVFISCHLSGNCSQVKQSLYAMQDSSIKMVVRWDNTMIFLGLHLKVANEQHIIARGYNDHIKFLLTVSSP